VVNMSVKLLYHVGIVIDEITTILLAYTIVLQF